VNRIDVDRLRSDFFGRDPVAGDEALQLAVSHGAAALRLLLPEREYVGSTALQSQIRLGKLTAAVGDAAADHLLTLMRTAGWSVRAVATAAFAGLQDHERVAGDLVDLLQHSDIDLQRHTVEALGYLGSDGWAFDIVQFAQCREWAIQEVRHPSHDYLNKFACYAFQALVRMTRGQDSGDRISRCLRLFGALLAVCEEAGTARPSPWDIYLVQHNLGPRAADALISEWLGSKNVFLQEAGVDALGNLRLNRTIPVLLGVMENPSLDESVRRTAGVNLGQFGNPAAATELARRLERDARLPGFQWAFSALYGQRVDWPECGELVAATLEGRNAEVAAQMSYSLACRGAANTDAVAAGLDASDSFTRGASALTCARHDPERARALLSGRDAEAATPLEHAFFLAAQVHAGEREKADSLHQVLQDVESLAYLRLIWKREILHAFFAADGADSRRGRLWCEAALESADRIEAEMKTLVASPAKMPDARSSTPHVSTADATAGGASVRAPTASTAAWSFDVFISHASEDKERIARPLYTALMKAGVSVWFDEATLKLGDSLRRKIDDGLSRCRYGIVILSPSFLAKQWPQTELNGLVARETASGEKAILPIWHDLDGKDLLRASPTLADRLACRSSEELDVIVAQVLEVLKD